MIWLWIGFVQVLSRFNRKHHLICCDPECRSSTRSVTTPDIRFSCGSPSECVGTLNLRWPMGRIIAPLVLRCSTVLRNQDLAIFIEGAFMLSGKNESPVTSATPPDPLAALPEPPPSATKDEICGAVRKAVERLGRVCSRDIQISIENEQMCLRGSVKTYFHKQLAQHAAMQTPGVRRLINEIRVDISNARRTSDDW